MKVESTKYEALKSIRNTQLKKMFQKEKKYLE